MDNTIIIRASQEVTKKWEVIKNDNKLSIEKKIQKVINIPLQDVKNILSIGKIT